MSSSLVLELALLVLETAWLVLEMAWLVLQMLGRWVDGAAQGMYGRSGGAKGHQMGIT